MSPDNISFLLCKFPCVETGSEPHSASCLVGTGFGVWLWPLTPIQHRGQEQVNFFSPKNDPDVNKGGDNRFPTITRLEGAMVPLFKYSLLYCTVARGWNRLLYYVWNMYFFYKCINPFHELILCIFKKHVVSVDDENSSRLLGGH
jgi:hypothetical protein